LVPTFSGHPHRFLLISPDFPIGNSHTPGQPGIVVGQGTNRDCHIHPCYNTW
jgi:hypothetical protein